MIKTYDLRSLYNAQYVRSLCLVLLGAVYSFQVSAQSATAGDVFSYVYYQASGNTTSVNAGGSSSTAVRDMGWGPSASSGNTVNWKGSPTIRNGSGNPLVVDVIAKTPGAKAAKIISAGAKALPIIGTGVMIWELCKELGFGCGKDSSGNPVVTKPDPTVCTAAPCYQYRVNAYPEYSPQWKSSPDGACTDGARQYRQAKIAQGYTLAFTASVIGGACHIYNEYGEATPPTGTGIEQQSVAPAPAGSAETPSSLQELEDAIASKSGWPTSSHIHDALKEAATATGQRIPVESPTVTGPATSKGTTTTTTNPSAGTTTTTTTTHNHTYNDNRVATTITTSVNVTNNSTGQGTTTTTTTEPADEQTECEKNPNSLNCADLDTPEGDIPKTEKRITYAAENLGFAGGSCPADVVQVINGQSLKIINWSQNCGYITTYAKPMILAAATFAALMIIFVGGKLE